jgi:malonyl-CoA O-methyltransferase
MRRPAAEQALPEAAGNRRRFDRAAPTFHSASFLHDEARLRLLERLDGLRVTGGTLVDLGSGLGQGAAQLSEQYPQARVLAVDTSPGMLRHSAAGEASLVAGDAAQLPLPDRSVDLMFANLVLPWCRPDLLFAEARRVLTADGVLLFSTFGPDTLQELRRAWARDDPAIHVHAFFDVQMLGDLAVAAGLEEPVLDVDRISVSYQELSGVIRDLRALGATNGALGRRRGLTGRGRWQRFVESLWRDQGEGSTGRLSLTVELIMGQAFGSNSASRTGRSGEVVIPLSELGTRLK